MKQFDFEVKKTGSGREILPADGYVCNILSAKEETFSWGSRLVLAIDVAEGVYEGFFKRDFDNNDREDKKWRGIYRVNIPKDDGTDQDNWTKRTFGNFIWSVQESNPGYTWDWNEKSLKGKKIGVIYRNREWEMNGRTGWTTEAGGSASVEDIRSGKFRLLKDRPLKDRPLKNRPTEQIESAGIVDSEDMLPF